MTEPTDLDLRLLSPNCTLSCTASRDGDRVWLELLISDKDTVKSHKVGLSMTLDTACQIARLLNDVADAR